MDMLQALRIAAEREGWSKTKIGAVAGVTEGAVRKWYIGACPDANAYQRLRDELPGFADLVDEGRARVAARARARRVA